MRLVSPGMEQTSRKRPVCYDCSLNSHCNILNVVVVVNHVWLFELPWTIAPQAPLSVELSRQEYWGGLPFPSPGGLLDPGTEPVSLASRALAGGLFSSVPPEKPVFKMCNCSQNTWEKLRWPRFTSVVSLKSFVGKEVILFQWNQVPVRFCRVIKWYIKLI